MSESEPLATLAVAAPAGGVVDLLQLVGGQRRRTFGSRRGLATWFRGLALAGSAGRRSSVEDRLDRGDHLSFGQVPATHDFHRVRRRNRVPMFGGTAEDRDIRLGARADQMGVPGRASRGGRGADAYLMKAIPHDWEDPQAQAILRGMPSGHDRFVNPARRGAPSSTRQTRTSRSPTST